MPLPPFHLRGNSYSVPSVKCEIKLYASSGAEFEFEFEFIVALEAGAPFYYAILAL
jgi:hypothetical protein